MRVLDGTYEGVSRVWLRWCPEDGTVIPTGAEYAKQADQRAERLLTQLRTLGIKPTE